MLDLTMMESLFKVYSTNNNMIMLTVREITKVHRRITAA